MSHRIYVASSWRNTLQSVVVNSLRLYGHEVYDFKNPAPGNTGFSWSAIDPNWLKWTPEQWKEALKHPIARAGFKLDFDAMKRAEVCVLQAPCGRSAHLEAGWFMGARRPVFAYIPADQVPGLNVEPELMYLLARGGASSIATSWPELVAMLGRAAP